MAAPLPASAATHDGIMSVDHTMLTIHANGTAKVTKGVHANTPSGSGERGDAHESPFPPSLKFETPVFVRLLWVKISLQQL